jgi:pimeloyl-ACP methyl ester carboxylesterase
MLTKEFAMENLKIQHSASKERVERLFPTLPSYAPPKRSSWIKNRGNRAVSAAFLTIVMSLLTACAFMLELKVHRSKKARKFEDEEQRRKNARKRAEEQWVRRTEIETDMTPAADDIEKQARVPTTESINTKFPPTEGGPDPMKRDVKRYASRVGLDCEAIDVQTEDGFILELWHIFDPSRTSDESETPSKQSRKYPVLMIHGLLQSSGAYCCTDDHSFAFYLAKSGLDVWLGNNRCGFKPRHASFKRSDPRMWAWNIKEMATLDLPALVNCVLEITGFPTLALVGHSQGTSQMLIALSKDFVPDLGKKISVVCLLAPAAYSGDLLENPCWFFKAMTLTPPSVWRVCFGKHGFLQSMIGVMEILPNSAVGALGYPLFHYLFKWSDRNWDRDLRNRSFLWAPVYVSSEHMRWWIGRDGFPKQRCILNTREEAEAEAEDDKVIEEFRKLEGTKNQLADQTRTRYNEAISRIEADPWFDERVPPIAMWIAGCDELVDGKRLLNRFKGGREPHVKLVHAKIIADYEHLDVIWAVDAIDQVGKELLDVVWRSVDPETRKQCTVPNVFHKNE